jgi:hypothetical protein
MSCRHDLALGTCTSCYPTTGKIEPNPENGCEENLEGPGAAPLTVPLKLTSAETEKITVVVERKVHVGDRCGFGNYGDGNTCQWLEYDDVGIKHRCILFSAPLSSSPINRSAIYRCIICSLLKPNPQSND